MKQAQIGIVGLAVMGANLARNFANHKIPTAVYNRTNERTEEFIAEHGNDYLVGCFGLKGFVESIAKPRKIILMVKAGEAVDAILKQLVSLLSKGDIIIDGGNSHYHDTTRRETNLAKKGIYFVGCGISGGEEGALNGPSLMPGGSINAWKSLKPLFEKIAAKDFNGKPCVTHIGTGGSGHYVKMVHNGIEYGIMQIMAEAYNLVSGWPPIIAPKVADIFATWNKGKLNSFLFGIAPTILRKRDDLEPQYEDYLIDHILDKAEQKGTGAWTVIDALEKGIPIPTIAEAVFARGISARNKERGELMRKQWTMCPYQKKYSQKKFHELLGEALHISILLTYAQGFDLIRESSRTQGWKIDLPEVARIWQGGCIIRAKVLKEIVKALENLKKDQNHLLHSSYFVKESKKSIPALKEILSLTSNTFFATPAMSASLSYFNSFTTQCSPANFIQGMRDYFGAHTYERLDRPGHFHADWKSK